jgi:hypothetical protein
MTNGNDVTQNIKHTNLFNKTKFTLYSVTPAHAPASVTVVNTVHYLYCTFFRNYCTVHFFTVHYFLLYHCGFLLFTDVNTVQYFFQWDIFTVHYFK